MALTLPIPLAGFWDLIPLQQGRVFEPDEAMQVGRTGSGTILPSGLGHRLWGGQVTFALASDAERRPAEAILSRLRQPGMPFFCYDRRRPYPAADPSGAILGAASVAVHTAGAGGLGIIRLKGLPAGYALTAGDLLGYTLGTDPVRYHLHQLAESALVDGSGVTPDVAITPFRTQALPADTPVSLVRPVITAIYDPGSFAAGKGRAGGWEAGRSFRFRQTLEY